METAANFPVTVADLSKGLVKDIKETEWEKSGGGWGGVNQKEVLALSWSVKG